MKSYYIYILADKNNNKIYIGVTNNLLRRSHEHRHGLVEGYTKKHKIHKLVYHEQYYDVRLALGREKQLKKWKREWKNQLIEKQNPQWQDLWDEISCP